MILLMYYYVLQTMSKYIHIENNIQDDRKVWNNNHKIRGIFFLNKNANFP